MLSEKETPNDLPLEDARLTNAEPHTTSRSRLLLVPLFLVTLFTGAVIGMYFQPPGLRVFFNATGLEPGAGTDTPIAMEET